jgi:hypothetical protein
MSEVEIVPQNIVEKKTLILNSRLDYRSVCSWGEALKTSFFVRLGVIKPRRDDISLVAAGKYYEPYLVLGGKYSIDYCRRHVYAFGVSDQTQKICFGEEIFKSETLSSEKLSKIIKIAGEERSHYQNETYIIFDRMMKEVSPREFPLAPFESQLEDSAKLDLDLRKLKISLDTEITLLRSRLVKRPLDAAKVIRETFEINQRLVVFRPVYELAFQNTKNGEAVTASIDGITGEILGQEFSKGLHEKTVRSFKETCPLGAPSTKGQLYKGEQIRSQLASLPKISIKTPQNTGQNCPLEKPTPNLKVKSILGGLSLVVGLLAANFALFGWRTPSDTFYLLGEYARYACAYGGLGAIIFGSMLINDFFVMRSRPKEQSTADSLEKVESDKEHVHFMVPEFEEEKEADSQVPSKQKP